MLPRKRMLIATLFLVQVLMASPSAGKKPLTFQDIMKFREIHGPVLSEDGKWLAYNAQPDRGDGEVLVHGLESGEAYTVERGDRPVISGDGRWVAMAVRPRAVDLEAAGKDKPREGMALLDTSSGAVVNFSDVRRFAFSEDGKWLAVLHHEEKADRKEKEKEERRERPPAGEAEKKPGTRLMLRHLPSGEELVVPYVLSFSFDNASRFLACSVATPDGEEDGLQVLDLGRTPPLPRPVLSGKGIKVSGLAWTEEGSRLAFLSETAASEGAEEGACSLWVWDGLTGEKTLAVAGESAPEGWMIPGKNEVSWSRDGRRLFFGLKPEEIHRAAREEESKKGKEERIQEADLFDPQKILEKRELDVWHWNDPYIKPHEKKLWPRVKDQTYMAVYHTGSGRLVQLADMDMPRVETNDNPRRALGRSEIPYRKEVTWYGRLEDLYLVDLKDGKRTRVVSRLEDRSSLSPGGRYVAYYKDRHWRLFDAQTGVTSNLTAGMDVPFFDEDHDYPSKVPSYGLAGWLEGDKGLLIYDKYDIWRFPTSGGEPVNLTAGRGRRSGRTFRILRLDEDRDFFREEEVLLLSSYHNREKHFGFYACRVGKPFLRPLLEEKKKFRFLAKAKRADIIAYTRESFEEFPDIWVSDLRFDAPRKVSDVNPQIKEFAWGKAELVEWLSADGIPLQGVLIKPADYEEGRRYPVIVYFYRFFSQRLHEFNQMVINHRPNFPFYTSNGYAVFLPDIRFDVGHPGYSATKCLVPGVQKLISMGVADPKAVGLHGHSWSGYQTAYVITQTDIFAAAVAGAPVSNMTSAYSGIRWGSGLARQFQYEKTQSRIGGSLWEYPERYIENSPVFFADRIQTPLLIQFGDEDGAVPWYQGIELFLAMRRLGKDCIFLQYRGEPHHLQKYANKLDYSIKMKEYFDHYLKGMPAPNWIRRGLPYRGK